MNEISKYFVTSFVSLAPLINPPGSAIETLGIMGCGSKKLYRTLARKVALNTSACLIVTCIAGPYILQCFGISFGVLELMGGLVLIGIGWGMIQKEEDPLRLPGRGVAVRGPNVEESYWTSRAFYPLTYPITIGPCSITVMLTLSSRTRELTPSSRISACVGLLLSLALMSLLIYICFAYIPLASKAVPPGIMAGLMRTMPFPILFVGAQLSWNGVRELHKLLHT